MSEKIYACLLRIFPHAFRRHYEEDALQLFRDRLSDERGLFRRLRLCLDLLADIIGSLPQAYRNSYAETAPADLRTPHFDGLPSFQVLHRVPIQRGSVVFASVLSFLVLAAFTYVMEGPVSYHPVARNGTISPIEAVMKNLNHPLTADSDVFNSASNDNAISVAPTGATAQPAHLSEHVENRPAVATMPSSSVSVARQVIPQQPKGILVPAPIASPFNVRVPAAAAVDLSGMWTSRSTSGDAGIPRWFAFKQDGTGLTGTAGTGSTEQYAITHVSATDDSVMFELNYGRKRFLYNLKVGAGQLRGTVSIRTENEVRTATVWLQRVH
jgi:hypothetical protein